MAVSLASTELFTLPPALQRYEVTGEYVIAIFYEGRWKETTLQVSLSKARELARDAHQRTGFIVQVRDSSLSVVAQFGYPVSEADCDDDWEEEE